MGKRLLLLLTLVVTALTTTVNAQEEQKREFRAVWFTTVSNIDWPSQRGTGSYYANLQKQEMLDYLDRFAAAHINVVCFQVRSMSDAMYKSSYEPWSSYLTGTRGTAPAWDPLEFIVAECHKRGMELHCWVNPYRFANGSASTWNTPQDQQLKNDGLLFSYTNSSGTTTTILNPGLKASRDRIVNVCREMITNYNVDGLIFDDYFYPNGTPANSSQPDYQLYANSGSSLSFADWRREQVNQMVRDVYNMVQQTRPEVRFGIGPAGVAGTAATSASKYNVIPCPKGSDWQYNGLYSDPLAWLNDGVIDYISPQLYWKTSHSTNPFGPLTNWWSYCANHFGRHHYASHNIYFMDNDGNTQASWEEIAQQIRLSRQYNVDNAPGFNFYSARYISGPRMSGLGDYLVSTILPTKAITPALTWKNAPNLGKPQNLAKNGAILTWDAAEGSLTKYAIYAIPSDISLGDATSQQFAGIKGDYLLALSYTNSYSLPADKQNGYWYAVTIVDGYNNEFEPSFLGLPSEQTEAVSLVSPDDGITLDSFTPTFTWTAHPREVTYRLDIASDDQFSDVVFTQRGISDNSYSPDLQSLPSSTRFYWRVTASEVGFLDATSEARSFTTAKHPDAPVPALVYPADGAEFDDNFRFEVAKTEGVTSYTLQVARDAAFSDIAITATPRDLGGDNLVYDCVIVNLGVGTFYWRVKSTADGCDDALTETRSFTITDIGIGKYEPGYIRKIDVDNDSYGMIDNQLFTNNWLRSVLTNYGNISWENSGSFNRSMTALGDKVYVSGRVENSSTSDCYLRVYSARTGERLYDILLGEDVQATYFPVNNVMTDDAGHLLVANMVLNIANYPIRIHQVDPTTGELTLRAEVRAAQSGRVDHVTVTGDVAAGNFCVYAAVARDYRLLRWTFENGTQSDFTDVDVEEFYPASEGDFGTAPRVTVLDRNTVIVNSTSSKLAKYSLTDGSLLDSFAANTALAPEGSGANGVTHFNFNGKCYLLYTYGDYSKATGHRFMLACGNDFSYASLEPLWIFPKNGLGQVNSTTMSAPCAALVSDDEVKIFVFAAGNGLATYTLSLYHEPQPLRGDVNLDGVVNAGDVSAVYGVILGTETDEGVIARADLNNDGVVNAGDISELYAIILAGN